MISSLHRCAALALVALAVVVAPAAAQDDQGRVKVRMPFLASTGLEGDPVAGVRLRLTGPESGASHEAVTGADGTFAFAAVAPGGYRLHVAVPEGAFDETVSIALLDASPDGAGARARKPREVVVVGAAPGGEGRIPAHTPEWTNLNDSDPGVTADRGHRDWIEITSMSPAADGKPLLLTIPPEAWAVGEAGAYFDLQVGETRAVRGGVVFGDGIHGRRPPSTKDSRPALRAEPAP